MVDVTRILEGIMTTTSADGSTNISPMGPIVDEELQTFTLRPYKTSTTYANLKRTGVGVFHVTDDVGMLAHAAVGRLDPEPKLTPCTAVAGQVIAGACRWYALEVASLEDEGERTHIVMRCVANGRLRDFFGINRAKHAVVEAAILATRLEFLPREDIEQELDRLRVLVEKTGGEQEHEAFEFLRGFVSDFYQRQTSAVSP